MSIAVRIETDSVVIERDGIPQTVDILPKDDKLVTLHWFSNVYCRKLVTAKTLLERMHKMGIDPSAYEKDGKYIQLPFGIAKQLIQK